MTYSVWKSRRKNSIIPKYFATDQYAWLRSAFVCIAILWRLIIAQQILHWDIPHKFACGDKSKEIARPSCGWILCRLVHSRPPFHCLRRKSYGEQKSSKTPCAIMYELDCACKDSVLKTFALKTLSPANNRSLAEGSSGNFSFDHDILLFRSYYPWYSIFTIEL